MTDGDGGHGEDGDEIFDLPVRRDESALAENDHAGDAEQGEGHAEFEFLQHFGHFDEEVGELGFFGRGAPRHVNFEHVGQKSGRDVQGETTEKDAKHEDPFEVFEHCRLN